MLFEYSPLFRVQLIIDVVGDVPPNFFTGYSHGFLTSLNANPTCPPCCSPGDRISLNIKRARRRRVFTAPREIPKLFADSMMLSSFTSRRIKAHRDTSSTPAAALAKDSHTTKRCTGDLNV